MFAVVVGCIFGSSCQLQMVFGDYLLGYVFVIHYASMALMKIVFS